jgi:hypothetical protein
LRAALPEAEDAGTCSNCGASDDLIAPAADPSRRVCRTNARCLEAFVKALLDAARRHVGRPTSVRRRCILRARWFGEEPSCGAFLMAPRGRTAYCIVNVRRIDPRRNSKRYGFVLEVERWLPEDVPAFATIFEWHWDKRQKRRSLQFRQRVPA